MSVFGRIVLPQHVTGAVEDTLKAWFPAYLAEIERAEGIPARSLPVPTDGAYVLVEGDRVDRPFGDTGPSVVIATPGSAETPSVDSEGEYVAKWAVTVAVLGEARDADSTANLAGYYDGAVRALLIQQGGLLGFAEGTSWKGTRLGDLPYDSRQTVAATFNRFEITVADVVTRGGGLKDPPDEPYESVEWPDVQNVTVDLEPKEAK